MNNPNKHNWTPWIKRETHRKPRKNTWWKNNLPGSGADLWPLPRRLSCLPWSGSCRRWRSRTPPVAWGRHGAPSFSGGKDMKKMWVYGEWTRLQEMGCCGGPSFFMVFWAVFDELSTRLDHIDPAVSNYVVQWSWIGLNNRDNIKHEDNDRYGKKGPK